MFKKLLMVMIVLISSQVAAEKIYKWVDENGQIHYSSSKPIDQEVETVKVKKAPKIDPKPDDNDAEEDADSDAESNGDSEEDAEADEAARKQLAAADKVNGKTQCDLANKNLNALNTSVNVTRKNDQGEIVRMTDDQRVNAMKKAQQAIKQYCK